MMKHGIIKIHIYSYEGMCKTSFTPHLNVVYANLNLGHMVH